MGSTASTTRSHEIEKELKAAHKKESTVLKLLLLGAGESGKTTVFKQLLLNKGGGFDKGEIVKHRGHLSDNIVTGMFNLLKGAEEYGYKLDSPKLVSASDLVKSVKLKATKGDKVDEVKHLTDDLAAAVLTLWSSKQIKDVFPLCCRKGFYNLPDTYPEMMEKLKSYPKWGGEKWTPTPQDCLLIRVRTVGVVQQQFRDSEMTFRVIDVGGQKGERRKWIPLFQGVTAVIFVASMAEYDQTLFEDNETNRLEETVTLLKSLVTNESFKESAFIVFMNKLDLFVKKFYEENIPLNFSGLFPGAPLRKEEDPECREAKEWYEKYLMEAIGTTRTVFPHFTTALSQESMKPVIEMCQRHVIERYFRSGGFIQEI